MKRIHVSARRVITISILTMFVAVNTACSPKNATTLTQDKPVKEVETANKPVVLTVFSDNSLGAIGFDGTLDGFMKLYGNFVTKKYPHISFKLNLSAAGGEKLTDLIASKTNIDIRMGTVGMLGDNEKLQLGYDITEFTKTHRLDLNGLTPTSLDWVVANSNGGIKALPVSLNSSVLFYNKDVFDTFATPYPKDNLTWDETIQLANRLTRLDGSIQYLGYISQPAWSNNFLRNQLAVPYLDEKTNRAIYDNADWKKLFDQFALFYKIPGLENINGAGAIDAFVKHQRVAMMKGNSELYAQIPKDVNWDVTNLPSFNELPGVSEGAAFFYWSVTTLSKNPEAAFLALKELISPEVQLQMSRSGRATVLKDKSIQQQIGADIPELKGKNTKAMFPEKFATPILLGPYTLSVLNHPGNAFTEVITNKNDVNTALRNAAESTNKTIAALIEAEGAAK